jgi:hypothetical protein
VREMEEWLRVQLDEDDRVARAAERYWHGVRIESATAAEEDHARRHEPARVLAEVEAKRRILATVVPDATGLDMQVDGEFRVGPRDDLAEPYLGDVLMRLLALPYADRPGFRAEWRL